MITLIHVYCSTSAYDSQTVKLIVSKTPITELAAAARSLPCLAFKINVKP